MKNLLLDKVEYKIEKTHWGIWRSFLYSTGAYFAEFRSHRELWGLPLIHYTRGISPETGKRVVAKGIIAIGRLAVGVLAIGHVSAGFIAIGQAALGFFVGLGQACTGAYALGQLALAGLFGIGQVATGQIAIAQFGVGEYVLAQFGIGAHVWSAEQADPEAVEYFKGLWAQLRAWWQ